MTIGEKIKELRKIHNITQEQLGSALGVTMQAVSKWEHGCNPDVSMLPMLADYFSVSINELFGCNDVSKLSIAAKVHNRLNNIEDIEEKKKIAMQIGLAIGVGFTTEKETINSMLNKTYNKQYGLAYHVTTEDFIARITYYGRRPFCFYMGEPKNGFGELIGSVDDYAQMFEVFADENVWNILMFLLQNKHRGHTVECIMQGVQVNRELVLTSLDKLKLIHMFYESAYQTVDGIKMTYIVKNETIFISFLSCVNEYISKDNMYGSKSGDRKKAILNHRVDS